MIQNLITIAQVVWIKRQLLPRPASRQLSVAILERQPQLILVVNELLLEFYPELVWAVFA